MLRSKINIMSSILKTTLIIVGILLAVWFISAKINSCNEARGLSEDNIKLVEAKKQWEDSLKLFKLREDSLNRVALAAEKKTDSLESIKNYVEKDLLASKSRAERLAAENARLKNNKDTSGQLANCDELAQEAIALTGRIGEYKKQYDSLDAARQLQLSVVETQRDNFRRQFSKADSLYNNSYKYGQTIYSKLQKETRKANKTVSLSLSAGYGIGVTTAPVAVKPQWIAGITVSKTLIRLW